HRCSRARRRYPAAGTRRAAPVLTPQPSPAVTIPSLRYRRPSLDQPRTRGSTPPQGTWSPTAHSSRNRSPKPTIPVPIPNPLVEVPAVRRGSDKAFVHVLWHLVVRVRSAAPELDGQDVRARIVRCRLQIARPEGYPTKDR